MYPKNGNVLGELMGFSTYERRDIVFYSNVVADSGGFEPPVGCPTPAFQASRLNHSLNCLYILE